MAADDYDIAGTGVGVVEADDVLGPDRVREGDVVIAMALERPAQQRLLAGPPRPARRRPDAAGRASSTSSAAPLGEELLTPTRIYAKDCLALIEETDVHALRHITGGGLAANLARVLPDAPVGDGRPRRPGARSRSSTWCSARGRVEQAEMERTFNMGVGMVAARRRPTTSTARSRVLTGPARAGLGAPARSSPATAPSP